MWRAAHHTVLLKIIGLFLAIAGQFNCSVFSIFSCIFHTSVSANFLQGIDESIFIHQPLVYCHFAQGLGEPRYHQVGHIHILQSMIHTHTS